MNRRTNSYPWPYSNSNHNLDFSLPPPENLYRIADVNWSMHNSDDNPNLTRYQENYYSLLSELDQLNLSNPHPTMVPSYFGVRINRFGSVNQNNPLNNGTPLSDMYPLQNPLQREMLFNDYINRPLPRGSTNWNGSSFGRNRIRLGNNGTSFQHRVDSLNGFHDHVSLGSMDLQNGFSNGFYATRPVMNFSSLEELKDKLVTVAMDQQGGKFLQNKIEEGNTEDVEMILSEFKDRICDLMVDQFANYVIQKLLDVCNEEQITNLLLSVVQDHQILLDICVDIHGTKVMQKLIENLSTPEQRSLLISALTRITVVLMKSVNGHHVIQNCFKCFPSMDKKQILNVIADNCLEIATDQSGCCGLQQCVIHAEGELLERLMAEITANALVLSEHPYGNYVVQHVIGLHIPLVTAEIVARLSGNFVFLSVNKHGSNVVEHILKECPDHVNTIITEIINNQNMLMVVQDPYGNYVIQTALSKSKGTVHYKLTSLIQSNYASLHSHLYGKRVLAKTRIKASRSFRM